MSVASSDIRVLGETGHRFEEVLTEEALRFVAGLHREVESARMEILDLRRTRQAELDAGGTLDFLSATTAVREDSSWRVNPTPPDLQQRRVEITGPTAPAKMVINALNSGADGWMADFEDALSPTWQNVIQGQLNLIDAINRQIDFDEAGKQYRLTDNPATILVRPRGWHLDERHIEVDGAPVAGALVDFGLFFFHNARTLIEQGSGPYFYLPKFESHRDARLWNQVFEAAQDALGVERGTIKATVLIETLPAAFEMDEILYELREHAAALNAGRWDYIFSAIKCFRDRREFVLPDRNSVTMTVPFMRAYTELVVRTCHRRGAHAIGGMAAFLPNARNPEADRLAHERVSADKAREAGDGFDGTWVAHPAFVESAMAQFDTVLAGRENQVDRLRDEVRVGAAELLDLASSGGAVTEAGLRNNVSVGIRYIDSWLTGNGAAGINGLMEDVATAEIARSQIWQWLRHGITLDDGRTVNTALIGQIVAEEMDRVIANGLGSERLGRARELFEQVALGEEFFEFLTLVAYPDLPD